MWSRWWVWKTLNSFKEKSEKEKISTFAFYLPLYVLSIFAPRFFNNICFYQDVHGRDAFSDFQHTCEILLETRQYFRISRSLFHTLQLKQSLAITHNFTWTNKVLRNYTKKTNSSKTCQGSYHLPHSVFSPFIFPGVKAQSAICKHTSESLEK